MNSRLFIALRPVATKYLEDLADGVPVADGGGHSKKVVHRAEIADGFHFAAITSKNESAIAGKNADEPLAFARDLKREGGQGAGAFCEHGDETN